MAHQTHTSRLIIATLAFLVLVLAGCNMPLPQPVVLGAIYSLNGGQAGLDVPRLRVRNWPWIKPTPAAY